ncbi:hypothetical protein ACK362_17710 [Aeromonas veronii]|jgi:hypothetical protein
MSARNRWGLKVTQNRSKAALFRNKMGAVKEWIVDGYGVEAISEKLRDEHNVDISIAALRKYIWREFGCGTRELRKKLSHEKKNTIEQVTASASTDADQKFSGTKNIDQLGTATPEADLNQLLDAESRNNAVNNYFGRKPK